MKSENNDQAEQAEQHACQPVRTVFTEVPPVITDERNNCIVGRPQRFEFRQHCANQLVGCRDCRKVVPSKFRLCAFNRDFRVVRRTGPPIPVVAIRGRVE